MGKYIHTEKEIGIKLKHDEVRDFLEYMENSVTTRFCCPPPFSPTHDIGFFLLSLFVSLRCFSLPGSTEHWLSPEESGVAGLAAGSRGAGVFERQTPAASLHHFALTSNFNPSPTT